MKLLKIYFSDEISYYKVKSLAKHILNNTDKLLFFIKNNVIKMCEKTYFEDWAVYYWYDLARNKHFVVFSDSNLSGIKIYISAYELGNFCGSSF